MQIEIRLQSDNYNTLTVKDGKIVAVIRGRLHDLISFLQNGSFVRIGSPIISIIDVDVVRGNINEVLSKISSDTEVVLIPMDLSIKENEIRVKLSEINMKYMENGYSVFIGKYVFRSYITKLVVSQ